jgi:hypothetical protein
MFFVNVIVMLLLVFSPYFFFKRLLLITSKSVSFDFDVNGVIIRYYKSYIANDIVSSKNLLFKDIESFKLYRSKVFFGFMNFSKIKIKTVDDEYSFCFIIKPPFDNVEDGEFVLNSIINEINLFNKQGNCILHEKPYLATENGKIFITGYQFFMFFCFFTFKKFLLNEGISLIYLSVFFLIYLISKRKSLIAIYNQYKK